MANTDYSGAWGSVTPAPAGFIQNIGQLAAQLRIEALQSVIDNSDIIPVNTVGKYSNEGDLTTPPGFVEIVGQQAAELRALALRSMIDNSVISFAD